MKYYLTALVSCHNCATYFPEWLEFHLLQGFEHFIIQDQFSTDGIKELLQSYVDDGIVSFVDIPESVKDTAFGMNSIKQGIDSQKGISKWLWVASLDEFVFLPNGGKVFDFLKGYEDYSSLAIQWVLFNSNGHMKRTSGLVTERFTNIYSEFPLHCKSIVQPDMVAGFQNPHAFIPIAGKIAVDENKNPQPVAHPTAFNASKIRINHYWALSREEYLHKMSQGRSDIANCFGRFRDYYEEMWVGAHSLPPVFDNMILCSGLIEQVKENMVKRFGIRKELGL